MRGGDVADLVEEERAALGHLEAAAPARDGPGEGALLVPEQLAQQQRLDERGAVDGDQRARGAVAGAVERRATSSLPVPLSPRMSTVLLERATFRIARLQAAHGRVVADEVEGFAPRRSLRRGGRRRARSLRGPSCCAGRRLGRRAVAPVVRLEPLRRRGQLQLERRRAASTSRRARNAAATSPGRPRRDLIAHAPRPAGGGRGPRRGLPLARYISQRSTCASSSPSSSPTLRAGASACRAEAARASSPRRARAAPRAARPRRGARPWPWARARRRASSRARGRSPSSSATRARDP